MQIIFVKNIKMTDKDSKIKEDKLKKIFKCDEKWKLTEAFLEEQELIKNLLEELPRDAGRQVPHFFVVIDRHTK